MSSPGKTARLDQHLASHNYAERVYECALDLIHSGANPAAVHKTVRELHRPTRKNQHTVERDTYLEVLDALNEEHASVLA